MVSDLPRFVIDPADDDEHLPTISATVEKRPIKKSHRSGSMASLTDDMKRFSHRASEVIVRVPMARLKQMSSTDGAHSLSRETQHFVGISTMHGPLRIYRGKSYSRWFWTGMSITAAALCIWQISVLLNMYLAKPTLSQVSFLIAEEGMQFPSVTVCSYNPVKASYARDLNLSQALLEYMATANMEVEAMLAEVDIDWNMTMEGHAAMEQYMEEHNDFSIAGFYRDSGFSCHEIFKYCSFGGRAFNCCNHEYGQTVMTRMGRCYTLQPHKEPWMSTQRQSGIASGLQIIVDFHAEEIYGNGIGNTTADELPIFGGHFETGFRYYIHSPSVVSYLSSDGITVSPGSTVYSALTANKYLLLPKDQWGNCSTSYPFDYETSLAYSFSHCQGICLIRYYQSQCGCVPFFYSIQEDDIEKKRAKDPSTSFAICTPKEVKECAMHLQSANKSFDMPTCSECETECESWHYMAYNSYGKGFSKGALRWLQTLNPNWTAKHVSENFALIHLYFRDLAFTEFSQTQSLSLTTMLSNIGGNLGMFLGMSIISFAELIIYIVKISWIFFSKKRRLYMAEKKEQEMERDRRLQETLNSIPRKESLESRAVRGIRRLGNHLKASFRQKSPNARSRSLSPSQTVPDQKSSFVDAVFEGNLRGAGKAVTFTTDNAHRYRSDSGADMLELKIDLEQLTPTNRIPYSQLNSTSSTSYDHNHLAVPMEIPQLNNDNEHYLHHYSSPPPAHPTVSPSIRLQPPTTNSFLESRLP